MVSASLFTYLNLLADAERHDRLYALVFPESSRLSLPHSIGIRACARRYSSPTFSTARNASCGMSTLPMRFIRFLPSFCLSSSLRLRLMSPP